MKEPKKQNARAVNKRNKEFWDKECAALESMTSADPSLISEAMSDIAEENRRHPLYSRRPYGQVIADVKAKRDFHHRLISSRAGRSGKPDDLAKLIDRAVKENPRITVSQLGVWLENRTAIPPIREIDSEEITLDSGKTIPLSGLKDRLSRAKKKLKSHNRIARS